jgi:hypothetical protein
MSEGGWNGFANEKALGLPEKGFVEHVSASQYNRPAFVETSAGRLRFVETSAGRLRLAGPACASHDD